MTHTVDILIVGAGQQGLALGNVLMEQNRSFVIVEAERAIGNQWRAHYDSLQLFTPRRYSALKGLSLQGDPDGYASKDEFAGYLEAYAKKFALPVHVATRVTRISKGERFHIETTKDTYEAKQVVIAGGYRTPVIPKTSYTGFMLHSSAYKNPAQVQGEKVLVVGNGNSAAQIAVELAKTRTTHIAMREMPRMIPEKVLGKSFAFWSRVLGITKLSSDSPLGRLFATDKDYVVGYDLRDALRAGTLQEKAGLSNASGKSVEFEDGTSESYDAIVFATGFHQDLSYIDIDGALNADGKPFHARGVSPVAGLYFAGLRNQLTNISSNIAGALRVARHLAPYL